MGIFSEHASAYRDAGFEPRPIEPGSKASKIVGWNRPDVELPENHLAAWIRNFGDHGIGLRLGSVCPNGTVLGALDIDDERYVRVASHLLGDPPCGRIGAKGIAYFIRIKGRPPTTRIAFDAHADEVGQVHVGELLGPGALIVIPPTVHPNTHNPYRWIGTPLLETDLSTLPIVEV